MKPKQQKKQTHQDHTTLQNVKAGGTTIHRTIIYNEEPNRIQNWFRRR